MARRDSREDGTRQHGLARDLFTRCDDGKRARGGNAEGVHGLADEVLTQHRADRRMPVTAACEGRTPGSFEMEVASKAVDVDDLADEEGATVAEAWRVSAELMPGVRLRDR